MQSRVLKLTLLLAGVAPLPPALAVTTIDNASRSPVSKAVVAPPPSPAAPAASAPREQPARRPSRDAASSTKPRY